MSRALAFLVAIVVACAFAAAVQSVGWSPVAARLAVLERVQ